MLGLFPSPQVDLIDEVISVSDENDHGDVWREKKGLSGISTGAALCAAIRVAQRPENQGRLIVLIQPCFGDAI